MRTKGINYDTGFADVYARAAGHSTHEPFDLAEVARDMRVIRDDLHCTAVRISGQYPDRLKAAATAAAQAGLEVWLSPFTCDLTVGELLAVIADCAEHAERLRLDGAEVVMVTGSEVSMMTTGFLPGETLRERLPRLGEGIADVPDKVNAFLAEAVALVRARFGGRVTYSSLPFERVDWTIFDIVATDAGYRSAATAATYRETVSALVEQGRALGRPVSVNEFGCVTYRGAADAGERGDSVVEWSDRGPAARLTREVVRDEEEQARYLREVLAILDGEGVDAAFWYTFARWDLPGGFDVASPGVVKVLGDRAGWEPKASFAALADVYGRMNMLPS
ncbi:hypothetical protein FDA94_20870 [Herbidospora galbida]|uniref:Abortive infection protein n=1 Tax=Herbidospora galbida TaxID=2575442 RepID=A0A4U3MC19_9ACTN|nr:hypothetical protein [Herbidospora galbida]TKK86561.1 hypothetical protein FDA94_20870 [Herbidospora galbida]